MDWQNIPITSLIPQRHPFVMVDKVLSCDNTEAVTSLLVREDNIFLDNGKLSPAGIIENMAQSCAARMGCINTMRKERIKIGFIGDIRECKILRQPLCGEEITTFVHIIEDVFYLTLASVTCNIGDEIISTARMKIALTDVEAMNQ